MSNDRNNRIARLNASCDRTGAAASAALTALADRYAGPTRADRAGFLLAVMEYADLAHADQEAADALYAAEHG